MDNYEKYATTLVKDVLPSSILKEMINVFMIDAGINMGNEFSDATLDRVIDIVENQFKFLPVCYIASAFKKGSLGNYGTGRLVPRTIYIWLNEITIEYNRHVAHKALQDCDYNDSLDLHKYPAGSAIAKKIEWYKAGLLSIEEWDKMPLKEIAASISKGHNVTYESAVCQP